MTDAISALVSLLNLNTILLMMAGIAIGLVFGALPGLGGNVTLALLVPLIWSMDPKVALAFLLSAHAAVTFGGSISSILINTPGTGQNVATCFDGFPMAQQGKAARAIGIAATSSLVGGLFGVIILVAMMPLMKRMMMAIGSSEYFMLALMGVSIISLLSKGSMIKGLISGFFGILISFIGFDPVTGVLRYSFGSVYFYEGIKFIPAIIGLFAIAEMVNLYISGGTIAKIGRVESKESVIEGIKDVFRNFGLTLRCSILGTIIGIIPGVGGTVANLLAYGHAVQTSKHPELFGTGIPEGVIAPEAANNAKEGGALIPTVGFGIPGSSAMAILLGAFIVLGIVPGPDMLTTNVEVVYTMIWAVALANIIGTGIGIISANKLTKLTILDGKVIVPFILILSFLGAFVVAQMYMDILVAFIFGIIGYGMKKFKYPKATFVIGFVLGRVLERNFQIANSCYGYSMLLRPITLILMIVTLLTIIYPFIKQIFVKRGDAA